MSGPELYPAIDLRGGHVVRLLQGDYDRETQYGDDPVAVAMSFVEQGARWIHVVDLDAALSGSPENRQVVAAIADGALVSLAERSDEQDVVTLSTLHAAKGLEWPHVVLAGVNEGLLPFRSEDEEMTPQRLEEERRLMYVGITRARTTLAVSTLRRRKRGRDTVQGLPSRFIGEMKLHEVQVKEDPRAKLKALREAAAARAAVKAEP